MTDIKNAEATPKGILKVLNYVFKEANENDSLVFKYSGHSTNLDVRGIGFLIPVDAEDEYGYVDLSEVKSRLDSFKANHIFVVFDSGFSGLMFCPVLKKAHQT